MEGFEEIIADEAPNEGVGFTKVPGFKVYGSTDGKKACDFSLERHTREKTENHGVKFLFKGWKIKIECTDNGWAKKDIIMLERIELDQLISVLLGNRKIVEAKRNSESGTIKGLTIENQISHLFLKFSVKENGVFRNHAFKITTFDALQLITLTVEAIRNDLKERLGIDNTPSAEFILTFYKKNKEEINVPSISITPTVPVNPPVITTTPLTPGYTYIEEPKLLNTCSDCKIPVSAKVKEFSEKKFGKCLCMNCQKK